MRAGALGHPCKPAHEFRVLGNLLVRHRTVAFGDHLHYVCQRYFLWIECIHFFISLSFFSYQPFFFLLLAFFSFLTYQPLEITSMISASVTFCRQNDTCNITSHIDVVCLYKKTTSSSSDDRSMHSSSDDEEFKQPVSRSVDIMMMIAPNSLVQSEQCQQRQPVIIE